MAKKTIKDVFDLAVDRNKQERENYTFRLDESIYKKFKIICDNKRVPMSGVIEEFIREVVREEG